MKQNVKKKAVVFDTLTRDDNWHLPLSFEFYAGKSHDMLHEDLQEKLEKFEQEALKKGQNLIRIKLGNMYQYEESEVKVAKWARNDNILDSNDSVILMTGIKCNWFYAEVCKYFLKSKSAFWLLLWC